MIRNITTQLALCFALLSLALPTYSQGSNEAKAVLDKTASIVKRSGAMEISFTASSFMSGVQKGNLAGTIYLKGRKFHIISTNILSWYNGKNLWTLNKATNEVNVSEPTTHERETMDPYLFIDLYRQGYSYSMKDTRLRGHDCYEIHLNATNKRLEVKEMILTIDKQTHLPICVRLREGSKYWVRISLLRCKVKQKYSDSAFSFNAKDFPQAQIIDIR